MPNSIVAYSITGFSAWPLYIIDALAIDLMIGTVPAFTLLGKWYGAYIKQL